MKLVDYPMDCCGMVEAQGIGCDVPMTGVHRYDYRGTTYEEQVTTDEDWDNHLKKIEDHQLKYTRNCALMSLANWQHEAIKAVERNGWKKVHKFYNPNSQHTVSLYVKDLWESSDVYREAVIAGYRKAEYGTERCYTRKHNPWEEEEHRKWAEENGYVKEEEVNAL